MSRESIAALYKKYLLDMQFERSGIFKMIRDKYNCSTALYPGSFIHITPSFFFPHVIYVDTNETAQKFFANINDVLNFINSYKSYKGSSFVRFIAQDFTQYLPIREKSYDLLISLYAGGISRACKRYLKMNGILLTNNHHNDANTAALDKEFELIAVMNRKGDSYEIVEKGFDEYIIPLKNPAKKVNYLKRSNNGLRYTDSESYYLFKRKFVK